MAGNVYESEVYMYLAAGISLGVWRCLCNGTAGARCVQDERTCTHDPITVFRNSDTLTGFLELEILKKLDAVGIIGIIFETPFPLSCEPFGQGSSC